MYITHSGSKNRCVFFSNRGVDYYINVDEIVSIKRQHNTVDIQLRENVRLSFSSQEEAENFAYELASIAFDVSPVFFDDPRA